MQAPNTSNKIRLLVIVLTLGLVAAACSPAAETGEEGTPPSTLTSTEGSPTTTSGADSVTQDGWTEVLGEWPLPVIVGREAHFRLWDYAPSKKDLSVVAEVMEEALTFSLTDESDLSEAELASFDPATGDVRWTPGEELAGRELRLAFEVTSGNATYTGALKLRPVAEATAMGGESYEVVCLPNDVSYEVTAWYDRWDAAETPAEIAEYLVESHGESIFWPVRPTTCYVSRVGLQTAIETEVRALLEEAKGWAPHKRDELRDYLDDLIRGVVASYALGAEAGEFSWYPEFCAPRYAPNKCQLPGDIEEAKDLPWGMTGTGDPAVINLMAAVSGGGEQLVLGSTLSFVDVARFANPSIDCGGEEHPISRRGADYDPTNPRTYEIDVHCEVLIPAFPQDWSYSYTYDKLDAQFSFEGGPGQLSFYREDRTSRKDLVGDDFEYFFVEKWDMVASEPTEGELTYRLITPGGTVLAEKKVPVRIVASATAPWED